MMLISMRVNGVGALSDSSREEAWTRDTSHGPSLTLWNPVNTSWKVPGCFLKTFDSEMIDSYCMTACHDICTIKCCIELDY